MDLFDVLMNVTLDLLSRAFEKLPEPNAQEIRILINDDHQHQGRKGDGTMDNNINDLAFDASLLTVHRVDVDRMLSALVQAQSKFRFESHVKMIRLLINANHDFLPVLFIEANPVRNFHQLLRWISTKKLEEIERRFLFMLVTFPLFNRQIDAHDRRSQNSNSNSNSSGSGSGNGVRQKPGKDYYNRRRMLSYYILRFLEHFLPEHRRPLRTYAEEYSAGAWDDYERHLRAGIYEPRKQNRSRSRSGSGRGRKNRSSSENKQRWKYRNMFSRSVSRERFRDRGRGKGRGRSPYDRDRDRKERRDHSLGGVKKEEKL